MNLNTQPTTAALIALYRYQNYPVRILHALLEDIDGIDPHTIFFKNLYTNAVRRPSSVEENLFIEDINSRSLLIFKSLKNLMEDYNEKVIFFGYNIYNYDFCSWKL